MIFARNVTVTNTATNYTLLALMQAAMSAAEIASIPDCVAELAVTADAANASPVLMGDANLSDTVYGMPLQPTQGFDWGSGNTLNDTALSSIRFRVATGGTAGQVLHVYARII
jgi:hypothetical protein